VRRAIIPLSEQFLESALKLPKGYKIHGFTSNMLTMTVDVHVTGPDLEEVDEAAYAPRLTPDYVIPRWQPDMAIVDQSTPIYDSIKLPWDKEKKIAFSKAWDAKVVES
jgi:hypothetical protein